MLVECLLIILLFASGHSHSLLIPWPQHDDQKMIQCVIGILDKYFAERKELTYVNMNPSDEELLQTIHSTMNYSLITRESTHQMSVPNQGYLVFSPDVDTFTEYFEELIRETLWNPYARFLIIIESLQEMDLRRVFDVLLRLHVNNALLLNGTDDGHLYTYNPFDNYACGRYYDTVISYGLCSETTHDLYPNKLVTGLKNCTFRGTVTHRPPFSIDPAKNEYRNKMPGLEQHLLKLATETDGFKIDFHSNYKDRTFTTVAPNMTAMGALSMLQKNETDVIFGAMMIIATRAAAFTYLCGHHDYVDELRFAVKKASLVPNWKYFYLEFSVLVWVLLLISLIIYTGIMLYLLQQKDKGYIIMELLDNLLLHGRAIRCPMTVKCVLLMWVWFAYLINTFYQSSLVSLTTNPIKEYQISDEKDMKKYGVKPCIGTGLATYIYTETKERKLYNQTKFGNPACNDVIKAMQLVSNNKHIFTLIPSYFYMYNKQTFNDKWGDPLIHYFEQPFAKLLLGFYFYKGFPISPRFHMNMIRMRENGLADKNLRDQYYLRSIKFSFAQKEFESRFIFPWCIYVAGCAVATVSFTIEILTQCQKQLVAPHQDDNCKLIECITGILDKYFSERKELTYVDMNSDDDTLLKAIHLTMNVSLITRLSTRTMLMPNIGYLIFSADVAHFNEYFEYLIRESTWNPYARFLIIIKSFQVVELRQLFDELLRLHVINTLVVNATDGHLYTYNPFENYACGRYYDTVISYGQCFDTGHDLYPHKLVTGLKHCNFTASLAHRPPYSMDPMRMEDKKTLLGTEEYIIRLLGKTEEFTVNFNYTYDGDLFSTVQSNMTAIGPMAMLQRNECDIIFGGMMMVTSRAEAFTYLCGYHDYNDELRFAVKSSSLIPTWKYIYVEFELKVWLLLIVTFVVFTIIVVILLRSEDTGVVVLRLLDNLLSHDRDTRTRFSVKCVLIIWVWFAYLINTFYQSSLFSYTTNPIMDFQVSDEEDMIKYNFKPCFSHALRNYLYTETNKLSKDAYFREDGCMTTREAMNTVSVTRGMFTLVPNYHYMYYQRKYNDKWGQSLVYYFHKPYAKFLYGYFFYKGFPITQRLKLNALRMRESGITNKNLNDHYYAQRLKQQFCEKSVETRFVFPWCICISGFVLATVTFIIELLFKYLK